MLIGGAIGEITMPHVSSPIAYPPSSSPPQMLRSFAESKKRSSGEAQPYSAKRRAASGNERYEPPALIFSCHTPQGRKQNDANKENVSPTNSPSHILSNPNGFRPNLFGDSKEKSSVEERAPIHILTEHIGNLREDTRLRSETSCTERLPQARTSQGDVLAIQLKQNNVPPSSASLVGASSVHTSGGAERTFFGVNIHGLLQEVENCRGAGDDHDIYEDDSNGNQSSAAISTGIHAADQSRTMLWTERYRARKFTDLIGDDRTHRDVLRWLKGWDSIVYPTSSKPKAIRKIQSEDQESQDQTKILLLTGPPGLGKTTLAHVCARQAGYEVLEINASDERSRDVVKGKIRDCVGTENVKGSNLQSDRSKLRRKARPFCVVVDEVDGVVSGNSSGEGGFIKALVDLVLLDRKTLNAGSHVRDGSSQSKRKIDKFRILRPIILICNDIYHPSLRPLRASTVAEIVHIRKPPFDKVVARVSSVFDQEGVTHDNEGVRRLCEATWGLRNQKERTSQSSGAGEGDLRSVLVAAEWAASKFRQRREKSARLSKRWIEENLFESLSQGEGGVRGIGRSCTRDAVDRVFQDGAGFPISDLLSTTQGSLQGDAINDAQRLPKTSKRTAMQRLQEIVDASGESDQIITDCFAAYPSHPWQDDTFLSKPNAAYDWLYFHDRLSSKIHYSQEWDLKGYLSQATLGLHKLFASPVKRFGGVETRQWIDDAEKPALFTGPRPDYEVSEVTKANKALLQSFQSSVSIALLRGFGSAANMSTDVLPSLLQMLTPGVKPVVVGGSGAQRGLVSVRKEAERSMIHRAISVMSAIGISYQQNRVDSGQGGVSNYIYRMEPPLDTFSTYPTVSQTEPAAPTRYAIRQALDQEYQKFQIQRSNEARQARYKAGSADVIFGSDNEVTSHDPLLEFQKGQGATNESKSEAPQRDFFGRVMKMSPSTMISEEDGQSHRSISKSAAAAEQTLVWVTFNEGFSNAVRKPVSLVELLHNF